LISIFAFFTASTRTPISAIVVGVEMVGGYTLLIPTVISVIISNILSGKNNYIYKNYVSNIRTQLLKVKRHDSNLRNYLVRDAMSSDFYNINRSTTITDAVQIMRDLNVKSLVVTNNEDRFEGMVYFEDLSTVSTSQENTTIQSIMIYDPPMLRPLDPIMDYFEIVSKTAISEIPVISSDDSKLVLSILSLRDINKLLNNINDPILPDLEKSNNEFQKDLSINIEALRNLSQDEDPDKSGKDSKIISKLKDYLA
jgi:CIC family chloride channel protein